MKSDVRHLSQDHGNFQRVPEEVPAISQQVSWEERGSFGGAGKFRALAKSDC